MVSWVSVMWLLALSAGLQVTEAPRYSFINVVWQAGCSKAQNSWGHLLSYPSAWLRPWEILTEIITIDCLQITFLLDSNFFFSLMNLNIYWKDWCWSWSSSTLATWCEELTHWKRPWCWERLRAIGKEGNRGWDGWMASLSQWTWVWANSER